MREITKFVCDMERIRLSKEEKQVLRLLRDVACCPDTYPLHIFAACVDSLERKGLAKGAWDSGHKLVDARITAIGNTYLSLNPSLRNPVDWKWVITTVIAIVAAVAGVAALFVACSLLNR